MMMMFMLALVFGPFISSPPKMHLLRFYRNPEANVVRKVLHRKLVAAVSFFEFSDNTLFI